MKATLKTRVLDVPFLPPSQQAQADAQRRPPPGALCRELRDGQQPAVTQVGLQPPHQLPRAAAAAAPIAAVHHARLHACVAAAQLALGGR